MVPTGHITSVFPLELVHLACPAVPAVEHAPSASWNNEALGPESITLSPVTMAPAKPLIEIAVESDTAVSILR